MSEKFLTVCSGLRVSGVVFGGNRNGRFVPKEAVSCAFLVVEVRMLDEVSDKACDGGCIGDDAVNRLDEVDMSEIAVAAGIDGIKKDRGGLYSGDGGRDRSGGVERSDRRAGYSLHWYCSDRGGNSEAVISSLDGLSFT